MCSAGVNQFQAMGTAGLPKRRQWGGRERCRSQALGLLAPLRRDETVQEQQVSQAAEASRTQPPVSTIFLSSREPSRVAASGEPMCLRRCGAVFYHLLRSFPRIFPMSRLMVPSRPQFGPAACTWLSGVLTAPVCKVLGPLKHSQRL